MPEMNGFQCTALIREKERTTGLHLPIVAMTAHAMKEDEIPLLWQRGWTGTCRSHAGSGSFPRCAGVSSGDAILSDASLRGWLPAIVAASFQPHLH